MNQGQYITISSEGLIINISDDINDILNYTDNYIVNNITLLKQYDGNVNNFLNNLQKWKIVYYNNRIVQGYYYFNSNYLLQSSSDNLKKN
jgi:hypothetical protein